MLEPDSRQLLHELLRPPAGFRFDRAIGTTFSLDLLALMTMPVSFSLFDRQNEDRRNPDPLALLHAIREHASRMHIFCQAGQIAVPKRYHLLFAHLEDSVIEVCPPNEQGVFHPKLTVLRFVSDTTSLPKEHPDYQDLESPVHYRLLCGSRNLTFDHSWDTMLVLEGDLLPNRKRGFSRNRPLGHFVETLPELAVRPLDRGIPKICQQVANELRRVEFQPPEGFDDFDFWPLGMDNRQSWPFPERMDRLLVMSPFLSDSLLNDLETRLHDPVLISRQETLDEVRPDALDGFLPFVLHPTAEEPTRSMDDEGGEESENSSVKTEEGAQPDPLTGLHAKLYVADCGKDAHVFTGSANATHAAFSSNVEFLVELRGPRKRFGVQTLVRPEETRAEKGPQAIHFDNLLERYQRSPQTEDPDPDLQKAEQRADQIRRQIARAGLAIRVEALESNGEDSRFRMTIGQSPGPDSVIKFEGAKVHCRPIRLQNHQAIPLTQVLAKNGAVFKPVSFEAISAFVEFRIEVRIGKANCQTYFVLNLPLHGTPEDRDQRLLSGLLANREQLIRYLLLLLAEDEQDLRTLTDLFDSSGNGEDPRNTQDQMGLPLLEPILQALERKPERLDQIARLVEDLSRNEHGRALLPDGFLEMWKPIWEVRKEARK